MKYSEMRQFLKEANTVRLSPAEKDVFLYYDSRIRNGASWDCPDVLVAEEIGRSRNSVCEGRNALKKRGWVSEKMPFRIEVTKTFSQSETRLEDQEPVGNATERVENATEPVGNATAYKDKGKQVKEVKEEKELSPAETVFAFWQLTLNHPTARFTKERVKAVKMRLEEGYSVEDLKTAILGCSVTPHNIGKNDRNEVYDDLELICRKGTQVERFIGNFNRSKALTTNHAKNKPTSEREKSSARISAGYDLADQLEREARAELEIVHSNGNAACPENRQLSERSGSDRTGIGLAR